MDRYGYTGEPKFRPLSPWGYIGYSILFSLPLVGFILMIVFACSDENINRRNYARSMLIGYVIAVVIALIFIFALNLSLTDVTRIYSRY